MGCNLTRILGTARAGALHLLLAAAIFPGLVHAQAVRNDGVTSSYGNGRTSVRAPAANGYWIPSADGQNVKLHTTGPVAAPGGKAANPPVHLSVVPNGAGGWKRYLAKALKLLPLIGTGLLVWELWDDFGARPDGNGGLERDVGTDPGSGSCAYYWQNGNGSFGSLSGVEAQILAATGPGSLTYDSGPPQCGGSPLFSVVRWNGQSLGGVGVSGTPSANCPSGGPPRSGDGKCATGMYSPATEADLELMLSQMAAQNAAVVPAIDAALDVLPFPIPNSKPDVGTVPDVTGDPIVTTGPNGTRSEQKTWQGTPANPGEINWQATTTVTNTDPNGNTTTETTTEKPEVQDPCELRPNSLGCMDAGEAVGPEIPNENKTVAITPMGGWGADNGTCPASQSVTFMGQAISTDNSLLCQFVSGLRPIIIAVAWVIAGLIVVGIRTSGDA